MGVASFTDHFHPGIQIHGLLEPEYEVGARRARLPLEIAGPRRLVINPNGRLWPAVIPDGGGEIDVGTPRGKAEPGGWQRPHGVAERGVVGPAAARLARGAHSRVARRRR